MGEAGLTEEAMARVKKHRDRLQVFLLLEKAVESQDVSRLERAIFDARNASVEERELEVALQALQEGRLREARYALRNATEAEELQLAIWQGIDAGLDQEEMDVAVRTLEEIRLGEAQQQIEAALRTLSL